MAYANGISIRGKTVGVYDVLLYQTVVASLWNDPGDTTTNWRSTVWYVENPKAGINHTYHNFNEARTALRTDTDLFDELHKAALGAS